MARYSRYYVSFAASYLCKFANKPTKQSHALLERAIRYIQQNKKCIKCPTLHQADTIKIDAYADAAMGNENNVYGQTGWIIFMATISHTTLRACYLNGAKRRMDLLRQANL